MSLLGAVSGRAADGMLLIFGVPIAGITIYDFVGIAFDRPRGVLARVLGKVLCTLSIDGWILFSLSNAGRFGVSTYGVESANAVVQTSDSILPLWLRIVLPDWIVLILALSLAVYVALN